MPDAPAPDDESADGGFEDGVGTEGGAADGDATAAATERPLSLRREARATLDAQLDALSALDGKAFRLLQFTAALVSAVAAVLSLTPDAARTANAYTAVGVGALLLAALTAAAAYAATPRIVGVDADGLERTLGLDPGRRSEALLRGYADWIRYNDRVNRRAGFAVTVASLLVAGGTAALALGVLRAFGGPLPLAVPLLVGLAFVAGAAVAGVHRQARRLVGGDDDEPRRPVPSDGAAAPQSVGEGGDERLPGQRAGPPEGRNDG